MTRSFAAFALVASVFRPCTSCGWNPQVYDYESQMPCCGDLWPDDGQFVAHVFNQMVKQIDFWYARHCQIGSVCVQFWEVDGEKCYGTQKKGSKTSLQFGPGDTLHGDIDLFAYDHFAYLWAEPLFSGMQGHITRKSEEGTVEQFNLGGCLTPDNVQHTFNADGKVVSGIYGSATDYVYSFGLLVTDPVTVLNISGYWASTSISSTGDTSIEYDYGTTLSNTHATTTTIGESLTLTVENNCMVEGVGEKYSLSTTLSHSLATMDSESFSHTKTIKVQTDLPAGRVWQWTYFAQLSQGGTSTTASMNVASTAGDDFPPCCLPAHFWHPADARSYCTSGPDLCGRQNQSHLDLPESAGLSLAVDGKAEPYAGVTVSSRSATASSQIWQFKGDGFIRHAESGLCLVPHGKVQTGASLMVYDCYHQDMDFWNRTGNFIVHKLTGLCLTWPDDDSKPPVILFHCWWDIMGHQHWEWTGEGQSSMTNMHALSV